MSRDRFISSINTWLNPRNMLILIDICLLHSGVFLCFLNTLLNSSSHGYEYNMGIFLSLIYCIYPAAEPSQTLFSYLAESFNMNLFWILATLPGGFFREFCQISVCSSINRGENNWVSPTNWYTTNESTGFIMSYFSFYILLVMYVDWPVVIKPNCACTQLT